MTLGVPVGSTASVALKAAFEDRRPLGDLIVQATPDGAILIVSATDGPMPDPSGIAEHFFTVELHGGRIVSVHPHMPAGGTAMEAINIVYESLERVD